MVGSAGNFKNWCFQFLAGVKFEPLIGGFATLFKFVKFSLRTFNNLAVSNNVEHTQTMWRTLKQCGGHSNNVEDTQTI